MTIGQEDILRFIQSEYPGRKADMIGEGIVQVNDYDGKEIRLTMNIFGDILECLPNGKKRIIAESDLSHNLDKLPLYARVKSWEKVPG